MKNLILVSFTLLILSRADGTVLKKTLRYEGVARIISLKTGLEHEQHLLLTKILDPTTGYLVEIACVGETGGPPRLSSVYMKVDGEKLTISDSMGAPKYLSGTGEVKGEQWNWNFLKFSMDAGPVRIEDVNFVVPGQLIARKQIFLKETGEPVQLWEVEMVEISEKQFELSYRAMKCPDQ